MADEEAEQESSGGGRAAEAAWPRPGLRERLRRLEEALRRSGDPPEPAAAQYCQRFCQTLLEYAEKWKTSEDHLPLLEVYTDAIQSYSKARPYLTTECENVAVVLERLALSCVELLLCLPHDLPDKHWKEFQTAVQGAHQRLLENGNMELHFLYTLSQEKGVWKNPVLHSILHEEPVGQDTVNEFMAHEDPILLEMRIKHLLKANQITQATILAKLCSDHQDIRAKGNFKQIYLVCLCSQSPNIKLIEEIAQIDCKDALEMICNLESEGDEKTALIICAAFLSRQLQHGEMDCAWELTLFWSKLQQRVDPSVQVYLERCRQLSLLTKTVYHIFFLIKIIQSETEGAGLSTCIELCVRALRLESGENTNVKISICKTISCLLPDDLEVKRACQLSEFLLEPTVDAYYAVEMLYNQPDQKYDEESLPVPNSLRCELLLVLKTRWPFDPEFWDWKTLKRQCLALMGEEASIVSSIDELNDSEVYEKLEDSLESKESSMNGFGNSYDTSSGVLRDIQDDKRKKREVKKLREKGFVSARFRNFQAYMQYCVLCDKEFLGHRIIKHAQKHHTDGTYSCPICAKKFDSKERLVPHVTLHVKQSSKERLDAMKPLRRLGRSPKLAISREKQKAVSKQEQRSIKKNSFYSEDFIVFNDNDGSDDENYVKDKSYEPEDIPFQKPSSVAEFTCPVIVCKKGFKYYKNLIAHVKAHKDNEEAELFLEMQSKKVICHYCRRHFVSVAHLNDHLQTHCGIKPYMCIQMKCKASFNSNAQLLAHRKEHAAFKAKCMFPKCGRIFSESSTLYEHEAQHYHTFTCKFIGCGKVYHSQNQLEKHLNGHQFQQEAVKGQCNTTVKYSQPSREKKGAKKVTVKTEPTFDLNSISNTSVSSGPLNIIKHIKEEPVDTLAVSTDSLEHTVVGACGQVLPSSKEFGQMLLPTAGLSKVLSPQTTVPEQMLPPAVVLGHSSDMLEKAEAAVTSSHIKKSPLSQGICDIILTQGKLAAAVNMIDTGNTLLSQIYTAVKDACNDSSLPIFQESKEVDCFNQVQQDLNVSVHSGTSKIDLAAQTVERQMGTVMHYGLDNQALYETSFVFPEFEDRVKAAANLLTLPSKTANGNLFVSSQSSLSNPLVASSALKQPPVQKFSCKIEGCTKVYSSIQSIGKHMKATHPIQYPEFTLERKRKKRHRSRNSSNATHGAKVIFGMTPQVGCSNNAVLPQHQNSNTNPSYPSEMQSVQTQVFPTHLENLVNPLLPTIENMNPGTNSHSKRGPDAFLSSQFEDLSKAGLPLKFENDSDPFLPLPAEDGSISHFPTLTLNGTNQVFSQLGNNGNHELLSQTEATTNSVFPKEEYAADTDSEFSLSETSPPSSEKKKDGLERCSNGKERRQKHSSRVKCPAIIRDGKFICRRCFRVFDNPRSLGGHLSKRSICKPIDDETEISQELLQSSGQASLLASMILSSNLQSPQQSSFSPEACFKDAAFLQSLAGESPSSTFLQNLLTQASAVNFNANVHDERNEIIKQALETAGIAGTLESTAMLPQMTPTNCVLGASTINTMVLPCTGISPVLEPTCNPGTLTDRSKTPNSTSDESNCPIFSADLLNTFDTGTYTHPVVAPQCVPSNSSRVSVISGPLSTISSQINMKKGTVSKKKKTLPPFLETNLSQNLIASDLLTAMGNLAKNVKENVQIPTDNLQQNFLSSCDSRLMGTMTNTLNTDNPIGSINNFKPSSESSTLVLPIIKTENNDSRYTRPLSCEVNAHSSLPIPKENSNQKAEVNLDVLKTNMNSNNFSAANLEVRDNTRSVITSSGPKTCKVNCATDLLPGNNFPNVLPADKAQLPVCGSDFSFNTTSTSASEMAQIDDNVVEILELLQRLKLENDLSTNGFESDTTSASPPSICSPLSPTSFAASLNAPQVAEKAEICNELLDKMAKPFVCREHTCDYCAMTKDALIKHYTKVHRYTQDTLVDIKKNQLKFSPFRCVVSSCPKTFTRNSNLRAHCQSVHHFSPDEMVKLRIKRPSEKPSLNECMITPPRRIKSKKRRLKFEVDRKTESSVFIPSTMKKEGDMNPCEQIATEQEYKLQLAIRKQNLPKLASLLQEKRKKASLRKKVNKELKGIQIRRQRKERQERKQKKRLEKDAALPLKYSPYRPYRCVHQDCFAAFTIQQNLILHYQAVHKPDLPTFDLQVEEFETSKDDDETESKQIIEFRCREYDCSRIFQEVASLIQHYMRFHEMISEEIEQVMSVINIGEIKCDQGQCASSFTTCSNYVTHLEVDHEIKLKQCREDGIYKCDCEGCDRIYATRSNLLRHIYSKHNDRHKEHLMRPRRFLPDDEENNSNKANEDKPVKYKPQVSKYVSEQEQMTFFKAKKDLQSELNISKIKRKKSLSLKCGKRIFFLKARIDALSECSDKLSKQYPCMIKGCPSIVTSDHNVIRHYKCHKITRAFTVKHRNILVVCRKRPVPHVKSVSSDDEGVCDETSEIRESPASSSVSSDESVASALQLSETEKDEVDELAELLDTKLVNEDHGAFEDQARTSSSVIGDFEETSASPPEKQTSSNILKRAHKEKHVSENKKRKVEDPEEELSVELSSVHSGEETIASDAIDEQALEEPPPVFDWSSFKPMGFEVSFLKFLEESAVKQKKNANRDYHSMGTKKDLNLKKTSEKTSLIDDTCPSTDCKNLVQFANPSQLQCIGIVQFVLDETLKDCTELALKQLQEMKPTVILKKVNMHCDDDTVASEPSFGNIGTKCSVEN